MSHKLMSRDGATASVRNLGKSHFINNEEFTLELAERQRLNKERLEQGLEPLPISNSIGRKIQMIAEALSKKHYFIGYSWRDEMVSDGIMDCLRYIDRFDPEKGKNPLAYYQQICFYAFIRRIHDEKKQSYVKYRIISNLGTVLEDIGVELHDQDEDFKNHVTELLQLQGNKSLEETFTKRDKKEKDAREKKKLLDAVAKGNDSSIVNIEDFVGED